MEEKDKFSALMQLAEFARSTRDERRKNEWKLSFALWALLAAAVASNALKSFPLYGLLAAAFLIIAFHGWWVGWHAYRANTEATAMYSFAHHAEKQLHDGATHFQARSKPNPWDIVRHPPALMQWGITLFLVIAVLAIARSEPPQISL